MRGRIKNINIKKLKLSRPSRKGMVSSKVLRVSLIVIAVFVALVFIRTRFISPRVAGTSSDQVEVSGPRAEEEINREFKFPIKDKNSETLGEVEFSITKVEMRDQLVIKNQRVNSLKGRTYLVLNLKITNSFEKAIQMNSRDYIRLSVNGNEDEWLAPELHNDPVEIQAISTKLTRVAFPINTNDKNLVLQVGEIKGEKQKVELSITP